MVLNSSPLRNEISLYFRKGQKKPQAEKKKKKKATCKQTVLVPVRGDVAYEDRVLIPVCAHGCA